MTYAEAVARLLALRGGEHAGMRPGLERIEGLLAALGHPEERFTIAQVGGTNGKGSSAALLAAMLKADGHRVGLYTSPHLVSFRERIRVNGEPISPDAVVDGVDALGTLVARSDATMFEATTALALDHFAREGVDVAVLEVGMGGRLDATTVGVPAVTVLTRIDRDHEAYLGTTLAAIATEKAAIIRGGLAVSAAQHPEVEAVVLRHAAAAHVPLVLEGRDLHVSVHERSVKGQVITCVGPAFRLAEARLGLLGSYQPSNALVAVAAARHLDLGERAIRDGLARARWPGRFQVIPGRPTLVLDGAHNPSGARALAASLRDVFGDTPITLVLGVSADKDAAAIVEALAPAVTRIVLTRAAHPRAADPQSLPAVGEVTRSSAEALDVAMGDARTPIVCVAGSLFLVGEVLARLGGGGDNPCPVEKRADSIEPLFS
jgi:dihydrofolate synthase/folylpolyglutamate synthase